MKTDEISALIKKVADEEVAPRFRNLKEDEVIFKEPGEFVTTADLAAEFALTRGLQELYPSAIVTGEEDIAKNPMRLVELLSADCGFLIDPIDGTNNYIKGNDRFAVMAVALQFGKVAASWIYLPVFETLAVAEKGSGTFLNGEKCTLSPPITKLCEMTGAAHINRMPEVHRAMAQKNLKIFKENRPAYCAGYDYVSLLTGKKDFSVYHRTLLWDHLPGTLLYSEAGGYVRTLDGGEYSSRNDGTGLLCAANKHIWKGIKETLFPS
tara:strand:+ start:40263 stop:41060 length:798 start_codon:yes stop_codon:yes gene_type:complete